MKSWFKETRAEAAELGYWQRMRTAFFNKIIGGMVSTDQIMNALNHGSKVRMEEARTLGESGDPQAIASLLRTLTDESFAVRVEAAGALVKYGAPAVAPLCGMLTHRDRDVRTVTIDALGKIGDERAIEPLIGAMQDQDWMVRMVASRALGRLRRRDTLPALKARLSLIDGERSRPVRSSIRSAIDTIEKATAETAGLPHAAEPEIPDIDRRPRAGKDAENP